MNFLDEDNNANVESCIHIIKFSEVLSNMKFQSVSSNVVKAFRTVSVNRFHNLTRLEINVADCLDFSAIFNNFLENMDNLEHLIIKGWDWVCSCSRQSWWTEPLNVPKCLQSQVTTLSFNYMNIDCYGQLELLRYFLKNAKVLQMLTVCTSIMPVKNQHELLKKISSIPRGSRTCQVEFT